MCASLCVCADSHTGDVSLEKIPLSLLKIPSRFQELDRSLTLAGTYPIWATVKFLIPSSSIVHYSLCKSI
jgi:hypothetical protein